MYGPYFPMGNYYLYGVSSVNNYNYTLTSLGSKTQGKIFPFATQRPESNFSTNTLRSGEVNLACN